MDLVRRTGKPPIEINPAIRGSTGEKDVRPLSRIIGSQGEAKVVQHQDGKQTVVGPEGLKDLGIKP